MDDLHADWNQCLNIPGPDPELLNQSVWGKELLIFHMHPQVTEENILCCGVA